MSTKNEIKYLPKSISNNTCVILMKMTSLIVEKIIVEKLWGAKGLWLSGDQLLSLDKIYGRSKFVENDHEVWVGKTIDTRDGQHRMLMTFQLQEPKSHEIMRKMSMKEITRAIRLMIKDKSYTLTHIDVPRFEIEEKYWDLLGVYCSGCSGCG